MQEVQLSYKYIHGYVHVWPSDESNENEARIRTRLRLQLEDVIGVASSTELQVHSWLCTCTTIGQIERKWSPHWNCRLRLQLRSSHGGCYWCSKFNWVTSTFMVIYMYDHRTYRTKMKPLMELSTSVATLSSHGGCYLCTKLNWVNQFQVLSWLYTCMTIGQIERKRRWLRNSRLRLQLLSWHGGCYCAGGSTELQGHSWLCTCITIGRIERKWSPH